MGIGIIWASYDITFYDVKFNIRARASSRASHGSQRYDAIRSLSPGVRSVIHAYCIPLSAALASCD